MPARYVRPTLSWTRISLRWAAGTFDALACASRAWRLRIHSADRRLDGTIVGHLREVANRADDAYVVAHGRFRSSSGKFGGNATLTGVDRGNDLNGIYVIRLDHGKGVIVANTSSHQDGPAGGHGEVGMDRPLAPHNSGVFATRSCSGRLP